MGSGWPPRVRPSRARARSCCRAIRYYLDAFPERSGGGAKYLSQGEAARDEKRNPERTGGLRDGRQHDPESGRDVVTKE